MWLCWSYRVYQADCNIVWLCWSYRMYQADCNSMWLCWSYTVYQADCNMMWLCWWYRVYQADCNMMWLCWSYRVYQADWTWCDCVGPTGCIRLTVTWCDCVGPTGCIRVYQADWTWCDCVGPTGCIRLTEHDVIVLVLQGVSGWLNMMWLCWSYRVYQAACNMMWLCWSYRVYQADCNMMWLCWSYRVYQAGTFSYLSRSADSNTCWTSTVQHEVHQPLDHNWPLTSRTSNWSGRYTRLVCVHQYDFVGRLKLMNCPFKSDFIFAFSHSFLQQMNVCAKQHSDQEWLNTLSLLHQNDNTQHFTALNTLKNLSNYCYHFQQTIAQCFVVRHLVTMSWPTQLVLQLTIGHLFQLVVLRGDDGFGFTVAGGRPAHIYTVEPGEWSV